MKIKVAYIGGGSKEWAMKFMKDLALSNHLSGDIYLYDIDIDSAIRNQKIGHYINQNEKTIQKWNYVVSEKIEEALINADFVVLSILPATFKEMASDVHAPEEYGIYQTVGDTAGPGGIFRALRTVPMYEYFAENIKKYCPKAWVINFTNPMAICVKTLYDVFPEIKAFGCCHEVFHAQEFLAMVLEEELGLPERPKRQEISIDVAGVNHFTWISEAIYRGKNILPLITPFAKKHFEEGIYEGEDKFKFMYDSFAYGNKVKMDLYAKYQVLAAAGDRHLVEFLNNTWYLGNLEQIKDWKIMITPVAYRVKRMEERIAYLNAQAEGKIPVEVEKSDEEAVLMMEALMGYNELKTNVNFPNNGQVSFLPHGAIVESNSIFSKDKIVPIQTKDLPVAVENLIIRNCLNTETVYEGIKKRDLDIVFNAFMNEPLLSNLAPEKGRELFVKMFRNTEEYLQDYLK